MVNAGGDGRKDDLNGSKEKEPLRGEEGRKIDYGVTNWCALGWNRESVRRPRGRAGVGTRHSLEQR